MKMISLPFIKIFAPTLFAKKAEFDAVLVQGGRWGERIHLIPRQKCSFRRMKLGDHWRKGLAVALMHYDSEFRTVGTNISWKLNHRKSHVNIWEYEGSPAGRTLVETLAKLPFNQGGRLVRCEEGFEGQIWNDGELIASRWWIDAPNQFMWLNFIRSQDEVDINEFQGGDLAPQVVRWREDIAIIEKNRRASVRYFSVPNVMKFCLVVSSVIMGLLGGEIGGVYSKNNSLRSELNSELESGGELLQIHRILKANELFIDKYYSVFDSHEPMTIMGEAYRVLEGEDVALKSFQMTEDALEMKFGGDLYSSIPELVDELEGTEILSKVSVSITADNLIVVTAEVQPYDR